MRVKDIDFERNEITVREGQGDKDRVTMLPQSIKAQLQDHLKKVPVIHYGDLRTGFGEVNIWVRGETVSCFGFGGVGRPWLCECKAHIAASHVSYSPRP